MEETFNVTLNINDTAKIIDDAVIEGSITGECIDTYSIQVPNVGNCLVAVYEKHYCK